MMNIKVIKNELTERLMKPPCPMKQHIQFRIFKELEINSGKICKTPNDTDPICLNYAWELYGFSSEELRGRGSQVPAKIYRYLITPYH